MRYYYRIKMDEHDMRFWRANELKIPKDRHVYWNTIHEMTQRKYRRISQLEYEKRTGRRGFIHGARRG